MEVHGIIVYFLELIALKVSVELKRLFNIEN